MTQLAPVQLVNENNSINLHAYSLYYTDKLKTTLRCCNPRLMFAALRFRVFILPSHWFRLFAASYSTTSFSIPTQVMSGILKSAVCLRASKNDAFEAKIKQWRINRQNIKTQPGTRQQKCSLVSITGRKALRNSRDRYSVTFLCFYHPSSPANPIFSW